MVWADGTTIIDSNKCTLSLKELNFNTGLSQISRKYEQLMVKKKKSHQTHKVTRHHKGEQVELRDGETDLQRYWNYQTHNIK